MSQHAVQDGMSIRKCICGLIKCNIQGILQKCYKQSCLFNNLLCSCMAEIHYKAPDVSVNDLAFLKGMIKYWHSIIQHKQYLQNFVKHGWYFNQETIVYALFNNSVDFLEKDCKQNTYFQSTRHVSPPFPKTIHS